MRFLLGGNGRAAGGRKKAVGLASRDEPGRSAGPGLDQRKLEMVGTDGGCRIGNGLAPEDAPIVVVLNRSAFEVIPMTMPDLALPGVGQSLAHRDAWSPEEDRDQAEDGHQPGSKPIHLRVIAGSLNGNG